MLQEKNFTERVRFWNKVEASDWCWQWTAGTTAQGYGSFHVLRLPEKKKRVLAHRWAYEVFCGEIPKGLVIDHICRNRSCVNPFHMEVTTHQLNILRGNGTSAKNVHKTHCPAGHAYDLKNTRISRKGSRICRECARLREAERRLKWQK